MDILDFFWTFYLNHLSPLWGYFFATVKSFDADIAISGNFALNAKNSFGVFVCSVYRYIPNRVQSTLGTKKTNHLGCDEVIDKILQLFVYCGYLCQLYFSLVEYIQLVNISAMN